MKHIKFSIIFLLFHNFSYSQISISKNLPNKYYSNFLKSITGRYDEVDVKMGYAKGTGEVHLGNFYNLKSTPTNAFSFLIFVLGKRDNQFGTITNIKVETENLTDFLFRLDWKNNRTDQGTISGEIQLFYSLSKNKYATFFINDGSSVFEIFWHSKLDQKQNDSLKSILNVLFKDFEKDIKDFEKAKKNKELKLSLENEKIKEKEKFAKIGNPIIIGNLQIAGKDAEGKWGLYLMDFDRAKDLAIELGDGWRLPTNLELNILFKNKIKIGGFENDYYWSSNEDGVTKNGLKGMVKHFKNGGFFQCSESVKNRLRLVRDYDDATNRDGDIVGTNDIIGKPFKIGNLEVEKIDFPKQMIWEEAKKACENLGRGWRLPTREELNTLYLNKEKIGGFADYYYWSSKELEDYAFYQNFKDGDQNYYRKYNTFYVRAVRTIK